MRWLAVLFLVVPLLELWLLLRLGSFLGVTATVALVVATALVGAALAKREGLRVLRDWRSAMAEMRLPEEGITSGLLVLVGAVLLVTPGVLTDIAGLLLLFPATRRVFAAALEKRVASRFGNRGAFEVRVLSKRPEWNEKRVFDVEGHAIEDSDRRG